MNESRHTHLADREGARGRHAAARATMAFLASGRHLEHLASLLERHQMAAFQELTGSRLTLRGRRRYSGRRKDWPTGSARIKWETPRARQDEAWHQQPPLPRPARRLGRAMDAGGPHQLQDGGAERGGKSGSLLRQSRQYGVRTKRRGKRIEPPTSGARRNEFTLDACLQQDLPSTSRDSDDGRDLEEARL